MGNAIAATAIFLTLFAIQFASTSSEEHGRRSSAREMIELDDGGPDDLVWLVQLSDLHFSVHHPDRAQDFRDFVGPALSFINPSLVLLTGDLTDGKSKDLLTMKQDEKEWIEYKEVMRDVVQRSGLDKRSFYDVRGNHDNFGVPAIGGPFDFYSKYSINEQLQRSGRVNSITIQASKRKLLFVGFDSTMSSGLRGPTNLFGHPTDKLLAEINSELSQWDSQPVTKISFGHFPLSFSATSKSGKTLADIFSTHSLSAYLCGHLHLTFGKNLKRHHHSKQLFQLHGHRTPSDNTSSSKFGNNFWEFEMGDWRKSRAMRVLAIDRGQISFVDIDFMFGSKKTIILPTFPLDSRFTSSSQNYDTKFCAENPLSCGAIRALIFSSSPIVSVSAKIYDSSSGDLIVVLDSPMTKLSGSRGDLYIAPWNIKAFEDPSPERYLLQIETIDIMNRSTSTEFRPFSVKGIPFRFQWSWKEFFVMGCQWDSLYYPILWVIYFLVLSVLLIPKVVLSFSRRRYTYKIFRANKSFLNGLAWISMELYNFPLVWYCMMSYLLYLLLCPWFYGQVFTEGGERAYMTYRGWVLNNSSENIEFLGFPDVMVVVLVHLCLVVLPAMVMILALAAESSIYREYLLSLSSKKNDDYDGQNKKSVSSNNRKNKKAESSPNMRWFRKSLLLVSLALFWKHYKNCMALMKAYEMNPAIHFPVYSFAIPLLLAYTIWKSGATPKINGN